MTKRSSNPGLLEVIVGDGRPLLNLTAFALLFSGGFALFLSLRGEFLPHDVAFLKMSPEQLCAIGECRVVAFMFHDHTAFGGALIVIATLYLWLVAVPLTNGERWAWWTLAFSGGTGFLSFLAYLGYGYFDTWHGVGTAFLAPVFLAGLLRSRRLVERLSSPLSLTSIKRARGYERVGRAAMLGTGLGMMLAGGTILVVGMTGVFVPQDLEVMELAASDIHAANPRLIPLIAHDRAGFGGTLFSTGSIVTACTLFAGPSRSFWQALAVAGSTGFGCAIGVHLVVGYTDWFHLTPAFLGTGMFVAGLALTYPSMISKQNDTVSSKLF